MGNYLCVFPDPLVYVANYDGNFSRTMTSTTSISYNPSARKPTFNRWHVLIYVDRRSVACVSYQLEHSVVFDMDIDDRHSI